MSTDTDIKVDISADTTGLKQGAAQAVATVRGLANEFSPLNRGLSSTNEAGDRFVSGLRRQADTLGKTRGQIALYDAAQLKLTSSQQAMAQQLAGQIDAYDRNEAAIARLGRTAAMVGVSVVAAMGVIAHSVSQNIQQAEQAAARLDAVYKATRQAAGLTRGELDELAESVKNTTLFDDDEIRNTMAVLLTFKNVQGETFKDATRMTADLAALMGSDLKSAALQLGKALEDPEHNLGALTRAGVSFSSAQKEMIKDMVAQGRQTEALTMIMQTMKSQGIDGVAEAMNTGMSRASRDVGKAWGDLMKEIGKTDTWQVATAMTLGLASAMMDSLRRAISETNKEMRTAKGLIGGPAFVRDGEEKQKAALGAANQRLAQLEEQAIERRKRADEERRKAAETLAKHEQQALQDMGRMLIKKEEETQVERTLWETERGRYQEFSKATKQKLLATAQEIDAEKEFQDAVKASEKAVKEENAEYQRWMTSQKTLAKRIYDDTRTPAEALATRLEELNRLLEMGAIDWDTYSRAVFDAQDKFDDFGKKQKDGFSDLQRAVEGWGRSFSRTMASAVISGKDATSSIADAFRNLAEEIAAIQIQKRFTDPIVKMATRFLDGVFGEPGDIDVQEAHSGWGPGDAEVSRRAPGSAFAAAPRFHSGIGPGEKPAIIRDDESVLTPGQMRQLSPVGAGLQNLRVEIVNQGSPQEVVSAQPAFDAEGMIIRVFTRDLRSGGPLSSSMANTFGLRRASA